MSYDEEYFGLGGQKFLSNWSCLLPFQSSELSVLGFGVDFVQMGQCSPHPHISSALFWGGLFTIMWGIAAFFGRVLSSALPILMNMGVEVSFGGIGHDALATNKLVEAGMIFGHGVSSLVYRAVAVVVALGCCACGGWRGLLLLGTFLLGGWGFLEFYFGPDYTQLLGLWLA